MASFDQPRDTSVRDRSTDLVCRCETCGDWQSITTDDARAGLFPECLPCHDVMTLLTPEEVARVRARGGFKRRRTVAEEVE